MIFIANALGGWLIGQVAEAGRKRLGAWLLGNDQERALQQAATAAIQATARQLRPGSSSPDDAQGADHLARVIDQVFQEPPTPTELLTEYATLLQGLEAGVAARLAVLEDADVTGTGQSSAQLLGVSVPALAELLTDQLLRQLITHGASGGPLTPLADQLNHDLTYLQGQQLGASLARLTTSLQVALATLNRLDQQTQSIPAKTTPPGRPVHELTDPFALEVHRAIDAPGGTALPILPAYVERDHDRQLQEVVKQAAEGRSAATVLVGGSSTGKTRACWEALQLLPGDWRLWHPIDPGRPEAAVDALAAIGPRTVIWLNEAQHYLLTPASELGERVAAGLRELLRDPERGPVLLLGTIWPEYWATLTTPPDAEQQDDPHAQPRALLAGIDIPVPEAFTGHALQALEAAAGADPRLAEAAAHAEDGHITQFLAGAPALLERYRNAPNAAKAVIEAAMDARRLGHSLNLPHGLLEAAAPGYLTDQQWDELGEDWLERALDYCAVPCRGARGPLTRLRPRPGQPAPAQPHYRLADYLEQTGRALRQAILAPAGLWDALVEHADERDVLRIAEEATRRSLYRHGFRLYQRAAMTGDPHAFHGGAELLAGTGRIEEAIDWYRRAAEAGHAPALRHGAELLARASRIEEAINWYQRAAETGDPNALPWGAELLAGVGRIEEAINWYQRAAETGDPNALRWGAELLARTGRIDEAINWYQRAAGTGQLDALRWGAEVLALAGRIYEAIDRYQAAAKVGNGDSLRQAARLLARVGRIEEAIDWCQRAAETGQLDAPGQAAWLLAQAGRIEEAINWYQRAAETGDPNALRQAAELLENAGRRDEANSFYQRAAETGDPLALGRAARWLARAGRIDEAMGWLQARVLHTGDPDAMRHAVELLARAGRIDEAIDWLRSRVVDTSDPNAMRQAAGLLARAGRINEAIGFYQRAAETGDRDAMRWAAGLLARAGRTDEAIGFYQRAAENGDLYAPRWAAEVLARAGRIDEAIDRLQAAAKVSDRDVLQQAAELLARAGRIDEAIHWYQRAAETGDPNSLGQAAELLARAGRIDEAIHWYQRAAVTGGPHALGSAAELLKKVDRHDMVAQFRQYGLEPNGDIADEWH